MNENIKVANIYIKYLDGETVDVSIRSDGLSDFFDAIENGHPYKDGITDCGFYTPKKQIRYVSFEISDYKEKLAINEQTTEESPEAESAETSQE